MSMCAFVSFIFFVCVCERERKREREREIDSRKSFRLGSFNNKVPGVLFGK